MAKSAWTTDAAVGALEPAACSASEEQKDQATFLGIPNEGSFPPTLPMRGIFDIKSKHYDVVLDKDRLSWSVIQPSNHSGRKQIPCDSVSLRDVYAVNIKRVEKPGKNRGYPQGVTLHVATPSKRDPNVLTDERITLRSTNEDNCQKWRGAIDALLQGLSERPKRLRAFVNDWVNQGEATRVFYSKVVPIFQAAGTRLDVIVTTREGSAHQILQTIDFNGYDGLVCVGGDDTTREVVNGILERTQIDANVEEITPDTQLAKCHIPVGIIPVGLFNLVAHSSQGASDPFTAAVHIILGHRQPLDVSAIFHREAFIRFGFSLMYGFGGDCLRRAEKRAKGAVGARATEYAVAKTIFKVRTYRCEVEFLPWEPSDASTERLPCRTGCERCLTEQRTSNISEKQSPPEHPHGPNDLDNDPGGSTNTAHDRNGQLIERRTKKDNTNETSETPEWVNLKDDFVSVGAMTLPNLCSWCPDGLSPLTHLADGCVDIVLVRGTTRGEFVQHLRRHVGAKDQFDFPFVSVHRASAVRIHPLGWDDKPCMVMADESLSEGDTTCSEEASLKTDNGGAVTTTAANEFSMWNVDLELMAPVALEMRVHKQLLTVFAPGIRDTDRTPPGCGCL